MRTHEHVYAIATDDIWQAIVQAEDAMADLLEKVISTTTDESQLQFAVEMLSVIARHREQCSDVNDAEPHETEDDDDAGAFEIIDE
jgi:hypothetical protein